MKTAVVLLNWNGLEYLKKFLPHTLSCSEKAKVYVIDNGSTDGSLAYLHSLEQVYTIMLDKNYGFAEGYNKGLQYIDAELYCFLNTDVKVTSDWVAPFQNYFKKNPSVAIAQPHILDYNHPNLFEYAGAAGGYLDAFGYAFCRGRLFDIMEKDMGQYDAEVDLHWASGACFFIRKSVFDTLEGFDRHFFAHQEEIDLCWRARHLGYHIRSLATVKVWHIGGGTLAPSPYKTYLNFRNSLAMLTKNDPSKYYPVKLLFRLILDGFAVGRFLFLGRWRTVLAILKAHLDFYAQFFTYQKQRKEIQPRASNLSQSIVYLYYIKKIKKFKDLPLNSSIKL